VYYKSIKKKNILPVSVQSSVHVHCIITINLPYMLAMRSKKATKQLVIAGVYKIFGTNI
jgi:hypothetical protein